MNACSERGKKKNMSKDKIYDAVGGWVGFGSLLGQFWVTFG